MQIFDFLVDKYKNLAYVFYNFLQFLAKKV